MSDNAIDTTNGPASWEFARAKILAMPAMLAERRMLRGRGETLVATCGCFDLLHLGHVRSLFDSRSFGDRLIVLVNSDRSVQALKGPGRPVIPESERAEMLASLSCVDYVTFFDETTAEAALAALQPEFFAKGADYAPPHGKPMRETAIVEGYGGRIVFFPLVPCLSTSTIVERVVYLAQRGERP